MLILLVIGFSTNNIFLSPKSIQKTSATNEASVSIDKNILLDKELTEKDKTILTDTFAQKNIQAMVELKDYSIQLEHTDSLENGKLVSKYSYYAVDGAKNKYELILPANREIDFNEEALLSNNKIYIKGKDSGDDSLEGSIDESITGYPIYNPSTPFNKRNLSVAVVIPYNNLTINLSSNYQQYLNPILEDVKKYYLENTENATNFNFSFYPIFNSSFNGNIFIHELVAWADPYVNFSQTDFILIPENEPLNPGGGIATYAYGSGGVNYINTNEGLIIDGYTLLQVDYNMSSYLYTSGYYLRPFAHEIGHYIVLFNPQFSAEFGLTPHAHGLTNPILCSASGSLTLCTPEEYGDYLDIMGLGRGHFHEHSRVYYMGLSDISKVKSVTSSGIYQLCDIYYSSPNCPQELLIQNPNGNNLALELRTEPTQTSYGCPASYFDRVIVRATDLEEGGGLNDTFFQLQSGSVGGSVIIPYNYSYQLCSNQSVFDYGIPVGESMNLGLGAISILNISTSNGRKTAKIAINYTAPPCYSNTPSLSVLEPPIYYSNLFSFNALSFTPKIKIKNNDLCVKMGKGFDLTMEVNISGNILKNRSIVKIRPQQEVDLFEFPLPINLNGLQGNFSYILNLSKISNKSQSASFTGNGALLNYVPQISGPYPVINCIDNDPIPFTLQNLGANFTAYPPNGATVNITGFPPNFYIPDICQTPISATDVVCGSNTGFPQLYNQAFIVSKDCRFVLNRSNAGCDLGVCV